VVPILGDLGVVAVLDADSDELNKFDQADAQYLQQIVNLLSFI